MKKEKEEENQPQIPANITQLGPILPAPLSSSRPRSPAQHAPPAPTLQPRSSNDHASSSLTILSPPVGLRARAQRLLRMDVPPHECLLRLTRCPQLAAATAQRSASPTPGPRVSDRGRQPPTPRTPGPACRCNLARPLPRSCTQDAVT